jgi:hypothetical protein
MDTVERADGNAVRLCPRLVEQIERGPRSRMQASAIGAIGVLGTDLDKFNDLQASDRFADKIFFTTNPDARLTHRASRNGRNLPWSALT